MALLRVPAALADGLAAGFDDEAEVSGDCDVDELGAPPGATGSSAAHAG